MKTKVVKMCKNCGRTVPSDSRFCQYCGSNSIVDYGNKDICPSCEEKIEDDYNYCPNCGEKLNKNEFSKVDALEKALESYGGYELFYASEYFVRGYENVISITAKYGNTVSLSVDVDGKDVEFDWMDMWDDDTIKLKIKCSRSGYGLLTITNDYNDDELLIYVTNNRTG